LASFSTERRDTALIVYGHARCPEVPPIRGLLTRAGVPHRYINIHQDPAAAAQVRSINHGNESVPTLLFPDGSTLTEPSVRQLKTRLESDGYVVGWSARLIGYGWKILLVLGIVFAIVRALGWV
jgi:mycoredoxin